MNKDQKPMYRYCIVPECKNTIRNAPDKVFFPVPIGAEIRKEWCKIMRREEVSATTCLHCCEDHFNIEEDTENLVQYKIMKEEGVHVTLRLNKGVLPHKFHCQNRNMPPSPPEISMEAIKRRRIALIEEILSESTPSSSDVLNICETPQTNNDEAEATSHIEEIKSSVNEKKLYIDKAVQVKIKTKYRSKGVQVNFTVNKKNVATSPLK